jgi:hypothetical protein
LKKLTQCRFDLPVLLLALLHKNQTGHSSSFRIIQSVAQFFRTLAKTIGLVYADKALEPFG